MMRRARVDLGGRVFNFQQLRQQPRRLRVKRIPTCIPHEHIVALLETYVYKSEGHQSNMSEIRKMELRLIPE